MADRFGNRCKSCGGAGSINDDDCPWCLGTGYDGNALDFPTYKRDHDAAMKEAIDAIYGCLDAFKRSVK